MKDLNILTGHNQDLICTFEVLEWKFHWRRSYTGRNEFIFLLYISHGGVVKCIFHVSIIRNFNRGAHIKELNLYPHDVINNINRTIHIFYSFCIIIEIIHHYIRTLVTVEFCYYMLYFILSHINCILILHTSFVFSLSV